MNQYATIYAGIELSLLYKCLKQLDIGMDKIDYFMNDILDVLRYSHDFLMELQCLTVEIEHGYYYRDKLKDVEPDSDTRTTLTSVAALTTKIATTLYNTFIETGIYVDNQLPYDFFSFNRSVFLLRSRAL